MANYKSYKNKILELRSRGMTYNEIKTALKLDIPKSTLSYICHNVDLPKSYGTKISRLNKNNLIKAQRMAVEANKTKRLLFIDNINRKNQELVKNLGKDSLKIALAMLYLGEGSKWKSHRGLMLGSSDPNVILLYVNLLKVCYEIDKHRLGCRVQYRADQDIRKLERYWSKTTGIPLRNFYKTKPDPRTVGKPTRRNDYMGVCVVTCGGTEIQLELASLAETLGACSLEAKR